MGDVKIFGDRHSEGTHLRSFSYFALNIKLSLWGDNLLD